MAHVLIAESAWKVVAEEVGFFAAQRKEVAVYPLFGTLPYPSSMKMPWEMHELSDIEYVIVSHVWAPPRESAKLTSHSVSFELSMEAQAELLSNVYDPWAQPIIDRYFQLERTYIHSHWFTTDPRPSGTDTARSKRLAQYLKIRKLGFAPEIIVGKTTRRVTDPWRAFGFAVDANERVADLGPATVVPDDDYRVQRLLTSIYTKRQFGGLWEWQQVHHNPEEIKVIPFDFGWRVFRVFLEDNLFTDIAIAPWSDTLTDVYFRVGNARKRAWGSVVNWKIDKPLFHFKIQEVISYVKHEKGVHP